MTTLGIWVGAALLYGAFWSWYVGWKPRLTRAEVDAYMAKLPAETADPERRERMRAFLEADDGGEFFMLNLIRLHPEPVRPPGGGEPVPAAQVLAGYTTPFLRTILRRGCHPALGGRAAAG